MTITLEYIPVYSDKGYTKVDNGIFTDKTVSMAERGLYMLLSELQCFRGKDGRTWELSAKGLSYIVPESDKTIRKLFQSLMEKGFLSITRKKAKGNFFGGNEWEIKEKNHGVIGKHYTMVDNSIFRENLSLKQIGLLGTLLSLHEKQSATIRALNEMLPDSYGSIHARRRELALLGFFEQRQENNGGYEYSIWKINAISKREHEHLLNTHKEELKGFTKQYGNLIRKIIKRRIKKLKLYSNLQSESDCLVKRWMKYMKSSIYNTIGEKFFWSKGFIGNRSSCKFLHQWKGNPDIQDSG